MDYNDEEDFTPSKKRKMVVTYQEPTRLESQPFDHAADAIVSDLKKANDGAGVLAAEHEADSQHAVDHGCNAASAGDAATTLSFFASAPVEVVSYLFAFLRPSEVLRGRLIEKELRNVLLDDDVWRRQFLCISRTYPCPGSRDERLLQKLTPDLDEALRRYENANDQKSDGSSNSKTCYATYRRLRHCLSRHLFLEKADYDQLFFSYQRDPTSPAESRNRRLHLSSILAAARFMRALPRALRKTMMRSQGALHRKKLNEAFHQSRLAHATAVRTNNSQTTRSSADSIATQVCKSAVVDFFFLLGGQMSELYEACAAAYDEAATAEEREEDEQLLRINVIGPNAHRCRVGADWWYEMKGVFGTVVAYHEIISGGHLNVKSFNPGNPMNQKSRDFQCYAANRQCTLDDRKNEIFLRGTALSLDPATSVDCFNIGCNPQDVQRGFPRCVVTKELPKLELFRKRQRGEIGEDVDPNKVDALGNNTKMSIDAASASTASNVDIESACVACPSGAASSSSASSSGLVISTSDGSKQQGLAEDVSSSATKNKLTTRPLGTEEDSFIALNADFRVPLLEWIHEYAYRLENGIYSYKSVWPDVLGPKIGCGISLFPDRGPLCSSSTTNFVKIDASGLWLGRNGHGGAAPSGFAYSVRFSLTGTEAERGFKCCQLLQRKIVIQRYDEETDTYVNMPGTPVVGAAVIGLYPLLVDGGHLLCRSSDPNDQYHTDSRHLEDRHSNGSEFSNFYDEYADEEWKTRYPKTSRNDVGRNPVQMGMGMGQNDFMDFLAFAAPSKPVYFVPGECAYQSRTGDIPGHKGRFSGAMQFVRGTRHEPEGEPFWVPIAPFPLEIYSAPHDPEVDPSLEYAFA
ncbi:unnamed protein product [Amoebophrya sp. A120]|nr:unnamed protein product [Amoebophrya sp. A120]|eukprot:GSA120T00002109001.1